MLSLCVVFFCIEAIHAHDACIGTQISKHVAQNLDNPTWSNEDPYCGYKPAYLLSSTTLKYWNVMNKGLFNASSWDNKWCGMCLKVIKHNRTSSDPSTIVKLVDFPTSYDMELQINTYNSLNLDMDWDTDRVDVTPVVCPIDGALTRSWLSYELGGINHYYLEIVVWDHIVPVEFAYVKGPNSSWSYSNNDGWFQLIRSTYNEFESNNLPQLQAPFQLKVISIFDEEVVQHFTSWPSRNSFVAGSVQFTDTGCMLTVDDDPTDAPQTTQTLTTDTDAATTNTLNVSASTNTPASSFGVYFSFFVCEMIYFLLR